MTWLRRVWLRLTQPTDRLSESWIRAQDRHMSRVEYHGPKVNWAAFSQRFSREVKP